VVRTHERIETWDLPVANDRWESIRAADAYLRLRIGLSERYQAAVFDERGHIFEVDLHKAYTEWQKEPSTLKSVLLSYADTTRPLSAQLHAKDLDHASGDIFKPLLEVRVKGADAAEVRGVAQEAIEKAKQGLVVPRIDVPQATLAGTPRQAVMPDLTADVARSPSRVSTVMNHQWVIGLGVTVIGSVIATLIVLWIT